MSEETNEKTIELRDVPTVVIDNEGRRFALQLVDRLPGGVDVALQIRVGASIDIVDTMHMLRGAALEGLLAATPADFDRKFPMRPSNARVRVPVRAATFIGEPLVSGEVVRTPEQIEREHRSIINAQRAARGMMSLEHEEWVELRMRAANEGRDASKIPHPSTVERWDPKAAYAMAASLDGKVEALERELAEERAKRAAAEAQLAETAGESDAPKGDAPKGDDGAAADAGPSSRRKRAQANTDTPAS